MPRRKGQGISPTKRIPHKDGGVQPRKKTPEESNEDPGGGNSRVQMPETDVAPANPEDNKYLHKKFKKMATSSTSRLPGLPGVPSPLPEGEAGPIVTASAVNGIAKPGSQEDWETRAEVSARTAWGAGTADGSSAWKPPTRVEESSSSPVPPGSTLPSHGRHVCPYCKLACAKPSVLQKHIRAHTNERPYPCVPCGFAFKTKSNLYKHCRSRAHALKMEEHGTKFSYPLDETSDVDDEDDENNSNNTPPPSSSFAVSNLSTLSAPALVNEQCSSVLPNTVQITAESADKRPIYKPKFHKAAMYHDEEENSHSNKKVVPNLSLKIPTANVPSFTSVGSMLSKSPASPSPEFLQRHISKIISENQAIVETMDLWPKKHARGGGGAREKDGSPASPASPASPLSTSSSPGMDSVNWHKKIYPRQMSLSDTVDERLRAHHAAQSKLALALLRPSVASSPPPPRPMECATTPEPSSYSQQPLNLTTNHAKDDSGYNNRKRSVSEGFANMRAKQPVEHKEHNVVMNNKTLNSKGRVDEFSEGFHKNMDKLFHPQNPEGSIIKDLLLKAGAASAAGLSMQGIQEMVDNEFGTSTSLPHLQAQDDYHMSQNAQYICQLCKIPYRNTENLEIHQLYYCKGDNVVASASPRNSPPSVYGSAHKYAQDESISPKVKTHSKMKAKIDLKISPIKDSSKICQPFPSPGPLLGNTPLVESYYYNKKDEDDLGRHQKKQRLDSETSSRSSPNSVHEVRSISSPFAAMSTGGTTTLRSLEELSKCPMRPNSLQMFGGEVSILDGAGETKTMRIEPRGKSPGAAEYLNLPNVHNVHQGGGMVAKSEGMESSACSSPHVVTIARSGLNSGGTIVQVPLKANTGTSLVKPPRSSGGSVNSRGASSPLSLSPMQRSGRHSLGSPPNQHYSTSTSTSTYLSQNTPTLTTSYPDTPKLMPNITTPNLAVPGIPAPNMSNHLPFMPFTSILPDGTLINPLTSITAFNPLTLPARPGILHANLMSMSLKDHCGKLNAEGYPGGVVTIVHGGKVIPYVPGMPGPQTMMIPTNLGVRRATSPKPLDLASPLKEHMPIFKMDSTYEMNQQQAHLMKSKIGKSSVSYSTPTVVMQPSSRKAAMKEMPSPPRPVQKIVAPLPLVIPLPVPAHKVELPVPIPSIKVNNVSHSNESSNEEIKRPIVLPTVRKSLKRSESILQSVVKESLKDSESELMEVDLKVAKGTENRPKFLRPTSLPLKPGTFVPKQHLGSGLTPNGGNVLSLVSPETPRPKKSYGQLYLNGHSYTYLALKCSTRPFYCTLNRPQPMYVIQSPEHSTLSMYSNWKVCSEADPNPLGLDPGKAMAFYDSRAHLSVTFTVAKPSEKLPMTLTHSSYWTNKALSPMSSIGGGGSGGGSGTSPDKEDPVGSAREGATEGMENLSLSETNPKRVKIFDGGFESNEEYIYVRGRGRGRYVCEECGIRCKKPSMLKKHIRTHTDVRPFTCKHCNFSFKTKGNLTKHMKSKAHYKKCVELGIVPVPTVVDESYIDEECLARQQALRASRHGNGDTDSDDNEEDEDDDDDDDEDDDDMGDEEGKQEREAACSLLSLAESTRFSASTNHRYLSLGLIPLPSMSSRPSSYPYTLTFAVSLANSKVPEAQTPTLTNLTAQTEREKVSRNTGLALELREDTIGEALSALSRRNGSLIAPTGEKNRCYFPSQRTPTMVNSMSEKSCSDEDSDGFDYDNSDGLSDDSDMSDVDDGVSVDVKGNYGKPHRDRDNLRAKEAEKEVLAKEAIDDKNIAKNLCDNLPAAHMKSLRELRESYELSMGIKTKEEIIEVEMSDRGSPVPMDLSNKSMSLRRKLSLSLPYYAAASNGARTPTTPISEILTPVSEPGVLASLCSSMERFPVPQTLPAKLAVDIKETTMLQAYLTEKALQDVRLKQHQHRHNQGYTLAPSVSKASQVWPRHLKREEKREELHQVQEIVPKSVEKVSSINTKCVETVNPMLHLQVPASESDAANPHFWEATAALKVVENSRRSRSPVSLESTQTRHDSTNIGKAKQAEKQADHTSSDVEETSVSRIETFTMDSNKEKMFACEEALKMKDTFKLQASEMSEKFACVSMANNIVRNVVVGGIGFAGHQPSSPPSSDKKSPSPGKPKAEFMPPSIGPSSNYCSILEDGRSVCVICNKIFSKPSQLRLHVNIHYFERPFRCESCAVSFRTKGHLQKHERSVSHQNKVSMNSTFGTATMTNPRPFKCDDCKIAFRIHGHLAKHLRSKMHIMKLECVGKLPFGTYAEMEREGVSLNDIDTSDCDNSLESLQMLAQKLYEKDPSKLGQWDGERGVLLNPNPLLSSGDTSSDEGEPCVSPLIRSPGPGPLRLQHGEFPATAVVSQDQLDFKSLSLKSGDLKAEQVPSLSPPPPSIRYHTNQTEYLTASNRAIAFVDASLKQKMLPYQLVSMLPPKEQFYQIKEGQHRMETITPEESESKIDVERQSKRIEVEEKGRVVEKTRKRKSVDELDYADTSDGDNEVSSNQKFSCGVCFQDFNTQASLHVHSFVEHDSSTTEDEKTTTTNVQSKLKDAAPGFLSSPRKNNCSEEGDILLARNFPVPNLMLDRGPEFGFNQVPKSTTDDAKHWRGASASPNLKYMKQSAAEASVSSNSDLALDGNSNNATNIDVCDRLDYRSSNQATKQNPIVK